MFPMDKNPTFIAQSSCSASQKPLSVRIGTKIDDLEKIGEALRNNANVISVNRFCPYCMKDEDLEVRLPSINEYLTDQLLSPRAYTRWERKSPILAYESRQAKAIRLYHEAEKLAAAGRKKDAIRVYNDSAHLFWKAGLDRDKAAVDKKIKNLEGAVKGRRRHSGEDKNETKIKI